ncbi:MAG: PEGA domain-containing protein [Candidatus Altiarchaeales archaeon]|nr:PEGA domain-containing protein [Candidatus Altiarchaeales archaeon]MBD3416067.1 PEGA domain-containing protein [Candidatus Altiarchaeales archaeon]
MDSDVKLTIVFLLLMVLVLAGLIAGLAYLTYSAPESPPLTTTTSSSTTTSTASSTSSTTVTIVSTTTTTTLRPLHISSSPDMLYRFDDAILNVTSDGDGLSGAVVYVNGEFDGTTVDGFYRLLSLEGGEYDVVVSKDGHYNASTRVVVSPDTYATSKAVHEELSLLERQMAFADGKASVRMYETSFCSNCRQVRPKLDAVVDSNRDCIVYEKLSWYSHQREAGGGTLPIIVIEGSRGEFRVTGIVPMSTVKSMVERASGCDVS